jgi:hypothetical protein
VNDIIVPEMDNAGRAVTFPIVTSTDERGAKVLMERIRTQLEHCEDLKASGVFKVSARPVALPSRETSDHLEALVQKVADNITEMVAPAGNDSLSLKQQPKMPVDGQIKKRGHRREHNGKAPNLTN